MFNNSIIILDFFNELERFLFVRDESTREFQLFPLAPATMSPRISSHLGL